MSLLSIIVPILNEADNIQIFYEAIEKNSPKPYELIFVDDGSTDESLKIISFLAVDHPEIKCISFSRNFGHQNALMSGMHHAKGDEIIIMDGDLQHPPTLIPNLLGELRNGVDLVNTRRITTENISFIKKSFSSIFYWIINKISDTKIEPNMADFKAFNQKVLNSVLQFGERELFLRGIFSWIGYKQTTINFEAPARLYGKTKYSFGKMLKLALRATTAFSFKPLRMAIIAGSILSFAAFGFAIYALIAYVNGKTVPGWASSIIAIMLLGGTQLLATGLLGEYIASLFTESKKRPLYLIDKKINID